VETPITVPLKRRVFLTEIDSRRGPIRIERIESPMDRKTVDDFLAFCSRFLEASDEDVTFGYTVPAPFILLKIVTFVCQRKMGRRSLC